MNLRSIFALAAAVLAFGVVATPSQADAFWGHHRRVTTTYSIPTVPAYTVTQRVVVARPIIAPAPVVVGYAPAVVYPAAPASYVAPTTAYYAPTTTYYAPTTTYYAPAGVTTYYAPAPLILPAPAVFVP
jgi:hypothetical protein